MCHVFSVVGLIIPIVWNPAVLVIIISRIKGYFIADGVSRMRLVPGYLLPNSVGLRRFRVFYMTIGELLLFPESAQLLLDRFIKPSF